MRYAIVSDIHANAQAWKAVLADIRQNGADTIICLGDIVGYGPSPGPVMESVYDKAEAIVLGNHEAVIGGRLDAECFSDQAREVIDWTREQLTDQAVKYYADLPDSLDVDGFVITHAAAANPELFDYIDNTETALASFNECEQSLIFVGHTHCPAIFSLKTEDGTLRSHLPLDFSPLAGVRYIINVGSVGDPRDNDFRASYCLYDTSPLKMSFRKIPFDIKAYQADLLKSGLKIRPYFLSTFTGGAYDKARDWRPKDGMIVPTAGKRPKIKIDRGLITTLKQSRQEAASSKSESQQIVLTDAEKAVKVEKAMKKIGEEQLKKHEQTQRQQQAAEELRRRSEKAAELARKRQEQEDIIARQKMELRKIAAKKKFDAATARDEEKRKQEAERQAHMRRLIEQKKLAAQRAKEQEQSGSQ